MAYVTVGIMNWRKELKFEAGCSVVLGVIKYKQMPREGILACTCS